MDIQESKVNLLDRIPENPAVYTDTSQKPRPRNAVGFATTQHLEDNMPESASFGNVGVRNNGTLFKNVPQDPSKMNIT